ncbi:uncharacterized protein F5147DRAFT_587260 [Suillus discolor]|uniref:BTB domain-containing protein n=1 Tax=Suillus discolor TaxID=1912936 RepID=A0A9P7EU33_9AGAM|nr:uncharacterized protein F5147DRAFT_587260 [Suillus discolor]KAG2089237.1 hypothetical protein F5147DRAFT_587260 [Suillus discolor]
MENSRQPEVDGMCDDKPIHLNGISQETFELFLEFTFGRYVDILCFYIDELSKFLRFCDMYQCSHAREFIISRISTARYRFHPAKLINLAIKYHVRSIFPYAFQQLAETPITELTHAHRELMGNEVFLNVIYVQAALDSHRRIIAAEEPKILMHSNECQDPTGCNKDWHAIWWNGMGHFLLDGRNPQPYDDAVKRFKELQFGRVSEGCKDLMFKILDQGAAFKHAKQFLSETCSFLVEKLVFEPEPPSP